MKRVDKKEAALKAELKEARRTIAEYEGALNDREIEVGFYSALENIVRAGIYIVQDGKFRFVNHYASQFLGYSREDIIGQNSMDFVHPDDREMVIGNVRKMLTGERHTSYEFRTIAKDGSIHWIEEIVRPTQYEGRVAVLGNIMEVTEKVESREKRKELETIEASILAAIPHAVIGLKDRRIIFANDGVQSVFGWKVDELIGKSTRILYRTEGDYEKMDGLYSRLEQQKTVLTEFPCRHQDGTDIECMVSASRIGESLTKKNIVITYEDITERDRAKKELEQSREQLRNLYAHLQSVREKERTRIARELHDELGQLLTALNTDLIMLQKKIPEKEVALLEKTDVMVKLIDMTMKTLKRIYMDLRPGMLDHLGLVAAIRWQIEEFKKRSGIGCSIITEPDEMSLDDDLSTAIFRIFQETLTNILRHAEATKVNVRLKKTKTFVDLVVRDNGQGVGEEELAKTDSFGLIGIRERAIALGGTAQIWGEQGSGTTVKVRIPLNERRGRK
jgi:PAS domain S-box-containing protein